jgi:hypothetical protein
MHGTDPASYLTLSQSVTLPAVEAGVKAAVRGVKVRRRNGVSPRKGRWPAVERNVAGAARDW